MTSPGVKWYFAIASALLAVLLRIVLQFFRPSEVATSVPPRTSTIAAHPIVTDLTICIFTSTTPPSTCELDPHIWHRVQKDLYLHTARQTAWLYVALKNEEELVPGDLVTTAVWVGTPPSDLSSDKVWEPRPGGIWLLRSKFHGNTDQVVTGVDVLFGVDAVDPRPKWALSSSSLQLGTQPEVPVARLSILHGRAEPRPNVRAPLRVNQDGRFKILQISDTHMVTGVGICKDAIDAHGNQLPEGKADPHTTNFIRQVLDVERPDLVVFTGDQLHHDIPDSQSALFKVVSPIIERSTPFAAVFGNHDSEGTYALSRAEQMSILRDLPFSFCDPGPEQVDGIGNFHLQILTPTPSQDPLVDLYFLDSHGQIPSVIHNPDYNPIKQSQIHWFLNASQAHRRAHKDNNGNPFRLSLLFMHIPLPEFGNRRLRIRNGHRRERTECPSVNTHLYDALVSEGITAVGCGHDHVNDFCALLPQNTQQVTDQTCQPGPWLCYGGGSGFGGYASFGKRRFHRRMRVWDLDTNEGSLVTWKRVEYTESRVDQLTLAEKGVVVDAPGGEDEGRRCVVI